MSNNTIGHSICKEREAENCLFNVYCRIRVQQYLVAIYKVKFSLSQSLLTHGSLNCITFALHLDIKLLITISYNNETPLSIFSFYLQYKYFELP